MVDAPLIPDASLKLDLLDCSSLPGIDKRAIKFKRNGRLHLVKLVQRGGSVIGQRGNLHWQRLLASQWFFSRLLDRAFSICQSFLIKICSLYMHRIVVSHLVLTDHRASLDEFVRKTNNKIEFHAWTILNYFNYILGEGGRGEEKANRIKKRIDFTKIDRVNVPEPGSRALSADIDLECGSSWFASLSGPTDLLLVFDRLSRFFIVPKKSRRFLLVLPLSTIIRRWHAMVYDSTILPKFRLYVAYTWWKRREGNHAVKLLPSELEEFGVLSGPDVTLVSFGPCWNEGSC